MIKRILVPYDDSESANAALSIAISVSTVTRAELVGLYVENQARFVHYSLPLVIAGTLTGDPVAAGQLDPEAMSVEEEKVFTEETAVREHFLTECRNAGVECSFEITRGDPAEKVVDYARSVDFVIMGNIGRHATLEPDSKGLTVQGVLGNVSRPVLIVPVDAQGESRVVIAYDGSEASERALRTGAEFADLTRLEEVHLVTVNSNRDEGELLQHQAIKYLGGYAFRAVPVILSGRADETIATYASKIDASVVALGAFGTNRLMSRLFGSTAQHLLQTLNAAVLLAP